jgi:hypothetical protein
MSEANKTPMVYDDLEPVVVPVTIKGQKYNLREALEDAAVKINNARAGAARFTGGELNRVHGVGELQPLAVSLCLFKVDANGGETAVSVETVKRWPTRIVKDLYDRLISISGMDEKKTVEQIDKEIARLNRMRVEVAGGDTDPKEVDADTLVTSA